MQLKKYCINDKVHATQQYLFFIRILYIIFYINKKVASALNPPSAPVPASAVLQLSAALPPSAHRPAWGRPSAQADRSSARLRVDRLVAAAQASRGEEIIVYLDKYGFVYILFI